MTGADKKELAAMSFFGAEQVTEAERRRAEALAAREAPKGERAKRRDQCAAEWAGKTTTTDSAEPTRAPVTDSRSIVLDAKRGDLGTQRMKKSEIIGRVARMTNAEAVEFYETTGRELNGAGPHRDPLTAGWCFEQADRLKQRR